MASTLDQAIKNNVDSQMILMDGYQDVKRKVELWKPTDHIKNLNDEMDWDLDQKILRGTLHLPSLMVGQ